MITEPDRYIRVIPMILYNTMKKNVSLTAIAVSLITFISLIIASIFFIKYLLDFLFKLITREDILLSLSNIGTVIGNLFLLGMVLIIIVVHWKILSLRYKNVPNATKAFNILINPKRLLLLGVICLLTILFSSPTFFTKDKIYILNIKNSKIFKAQDISKVDILAESSVYSSPHRPGVSDTTCLLRYIVTVTAKDGDHGRVEFGENFIQEVLLFLRSNNIYSENFFYNRDCSIDIHSNKVKNILNIKD